MAGPGPAANAVMSWARPVVGLPLRGLPLELSLLVRDLLQPIDVLNCGNVCKEWRSYIYSPDSLFDLVFKYQTHSPDDSAVLGVYDQLMLHAGASSIDPRYAQLHLEDAIQVIKAHHWGVPAKACEAIEGVAGRGTLARLAGYRLMLETTSGQLELLDLLHSKRYTSDTVLRTSIYCAALTNLCFGYVTGNHVACGLTEEFANPFLLLWDSSISGFEILGGVEDLHGEQDKLVAIRAGIREGQEGFGLLRINVLENTWEIAFVPADDDYDCSAVISDGEGCAIFILYQFSRPRVEFIRMSTLRSEPVTNTLDLSEFGDDWDDWQFEVRKIGYQRHVQLCIARRCFVVSLNDLTFTLEPAQSDVARWKDSVYCAEDRRMEVRDLQGQMKSAFSHSRWYHCPNSLVLVNESFVVATHAAKPDCPGYHAYCFDQSLPVKELPRDGFERCR